MGHTCPKHYNPAEFVADLISIDFSSPELEQETRGRVQQLVAAWEGSEAAHAVKQHARMVRTASGALALGKIRTGPVAGWARCADMSAEHGTVVWGSRKPQRFTVSAAQPVL